MADTQIPTHPHTGGNGTLTRVEAASAHANTRVCVDTLTTLPVAHIITYGSSWNMGRWSLQTRAYIFSQILSVSVHAQGGPSLQTLVDQACDVSQEPEKRRLFCG